MAGTLFRRKFDVDGASGTWRLRELSETLGESFSLSGDGIQIGPPCFGQHVTFREGVAVHINAFNFPLGMAEKLAMAILAGMPARTAGVTDGVAHRIVN